MPRRKIPFEEKPHRYTVGFEPALDKRIEETMKDGEFFTAADLIKYSVRRYLELYEQKKHEKENKVNDEAEWKEKYSNLLEKYNKLNAAVGEAQKQYEKFKKEDEAEAAAGNVKKE